VKQNFVYLICGVLIFGQNLFAQPNKQAQGHGQELSYVIDHYTSETGLPQNSVKFLLFDKNGYLWMGTEAGLIRFDNKEFKVFGNDNIVGLLDERIQDMKLDPAGNVYAKNLNYQTILTEPAGNSISPIAHLLKTPDPYYYPTWGYLNKNPHIGYLWDSLKTTASLPPPRIHSSLANGDIYLIYTNDIYYIKNRYRLLKSWPKSPVTNIPVEGKFMLQLWQDGKIAIWQNGQLLPQNQIKGDILKNPHYLQGDFKTFWCPTGSFIFAGNSLYRISFEQGVMRTKMVLKDIAIESPACLYYNTLNNTYYFGSLTAGLYVVKVSDFKVPSLPKESNPNSFYAIAKLPGDTLFIRNTIIPPHGNAYYRNLTTNYFISTYADSLGVVYYENEYTFNSYQVKTDKVKELMTLDEHLISVLPYSNNRLLLCTYASYWIISKDGNKWMQKRFPINYPDVKAKGLYPLGGDRYILFTNNGVKWYDLKKNVIEKSILDSISFRSYYRDKHGRFWFGSDGKGAFMLMNNKIYPLPLGPMNAFKTIHAFIDDKKGHFWLTTNNGLYRVSIQNMVNYITGKNAEFNFYALDYKDGLPTNEFNGGANPVFQWLDNGSLVLPSMHGLVMFNPDSVSLDLPNNPIYLDEIKVDSVNVGLHDGIPIIKLPPDFNQLSLKVSSPYFGNPRNLVLLYRIQGDDHRSTWMELPSTGRININSLPAGDYQVQIKKMGYNSSSSNAMLRFKFKVLPHFYNTWWFYGLMLSLFALAGYIISRRRISALKQKNVEIERLVSERTTALSLATSQLKLSQEALKQSNKVKEHIIAMILHDVRSPVRFLGTISHHMIRQFMDRPKADNLEDLKKLHRSVGGLWSFIEQFFGWAVSQQNAFKVTILKVNIQEVLDDVHQFYHEILSFNGNSLDIQPSSLQWNTDKDILALIIRNLLDNANKYTENGHIWINARVLGDKLYITVKDTGQGLTDTQVAHYMAAINGETNDGTGSMMILQMLKIIGGKLSIRTKRGAGSVFTIILDNMPLTAQ